VIDVTNAKAAFSLLSSSLVGHRLASWSHKTIIIIYPHTILKFYFYA
jgi:hypothetical protein